MSPLRWGATPQVGGVPLPQDQGASESGWEGRGHWGMSVCVQANVSEPERLSVRESWQTDAAGPRRGKRSS